MAQFTTAERVNAAFKQVFRILGSSNTDDALGKRWYEELYSSIGTILPRHYWGDGSLIPYCPLLSDAQAFAAANPTVVSDCSQPASIITLTKDMTSNGRLWIARTTPGDENSAILGDWVQPNDFPNPSGQPSNGFACMLYDGAGAVITATEGAWVPYYPLGAVILGNGQIVGQGELAGYVEPLKVGIFRYVGVKGSSGTTGAAATGSFIRTERFAVDTDGQTSFTTGWEPATDSLEFYLNGQLRSVGTDYTISGKQIVWLNPWNPDLGVSVQLIVTDLVWVYYVNGSVKKGLSNQERLTVTVDGQTVFVLPEKAVAPSHIQIYLNGQLCDTSWYSISWGSQQLTWLNPVLPLAPGGLTLKTTDVILYSYIFEVWPTDTTVKRANIPITFDGQTNFNMPISPSWRNSTKIFLNGQACTRGVDWHWHAVPGRIVWDNPINFATLIPLTLKTTDDFYVIADNVGDRCCGALYFTELGDAPSDYTGHAGEAVAVNPTEDGLDFLTAISVTRARALIDPLGAGDFTTMNAALLAGAKKMELMPNRTFAERLVIAESDVDILGYADSVVTPPVADHEAFLLDGGGGLRERLRLAGFTVQMLAAHPTDFCGIRVGTGNIRNLKIKDLLLIGYMYYPVSPVDGSCGIALANLSALSEDIEVTGTLFQNWVYSCFTMWGSGGVRDVRVSTCMLKDYLTFGMDWYNGVNEIMINNNNFRTIYWDTPVGIAIPGTKSLFINGTNHHITFQNNTFYGAGKGGGSAVVVSGHAGRPWDVNIECNTIRNFLNAIYMNPGGSGLGRIRIVGNANSEGGSVTDDNADGLVLAPGVGSYFIGHNTVDV